MIQEYKYFTQIVKNGVLSVPVVDAKKVVLTNVTVAKATPPATATKVKYIIDLYQDLVETQSVATTGTTSAYSTMAVAGIIAPVGKNVVQMSTPQAALTVAANVLSATLPAGMTFPLGSYVMLSNYNDAAKALRGYSALLQVVKMAGTTATFGGFVPDGVAVTGGKADITCTGMSRSTELGSPYRLVSKAGATVQLAMSVAKVPYALTGMDRMMIILEGTSSILMNAFPLQTVSQRKSFQVLSVGDDGLVSISDPDNLINGSAKVLASERATISFGIKNIDVKYPSIPLLIMPGTEDQVFAVEMFC